MIVGFRHKGLRRFYDHDERRGLPAVMLVKIRDVLTALDAARTVDDLNRPSLRLHPLKGDLKGFWSVTVHANWRIIFRISRGEVADVDFVDYH